MKRKIEIHIVTHDRVDFSYSFLPVAVTCAYHQSFEDWHLRILDQSDGNLNETWLIDEVEKILGKHIDSNKLSYDKVYNKQDDGLCKRRDILYAESNCDIIVNFDDDDIYPPNYLMDILGFLEEHPNLGCIFHSEMWRYNLNELKYLRCIKYSGGSQWIIKKDLLDKHPSIRYCYGHCVNPANLGWPLRHISGMCADACMYNAVVQKNIPINKIGFKNDSIRMAHQNNERADGSWQNDVKDFGSHVDLNHEWLKNNIPPYLYQYYRDQIFPRIR